MLPTRFFVVRPRLRRASFAALLPPVAAAVVLHLALLQQIAFGEPAVAATHAAAPAPAMQTRAIAAAAPPAVAPAVPAEPALPTAARRAAAPASAASGADALPVYRTALAPAATLHYQLTRGPFSGAGDLEWQPSADLYTLRLTGNVAGFKVLTQTSEGAVDADGIAPLRFTDQRLRGSALAANFQRDKGIVTFSGSTASDPLPRGAQDRLSWMLQLGAVLNAEPKRARVGSRITFFVVGARGEADPWTFVGEGEERMQAAGAVVSAVKFLREARHPHDTQVEVWLDPARKNLPVRARFSSGDDNEALELLLREAP